MKIKLPENFKICRASIYDNDIFIHDIINDTWSGKVELKDAEKTITNYVKNRSELEKIKIPENFKIFVSFSIDDNFKLYENDNFVISSNNLTTLEKIANKTTELDIQIEKLNKGEEIEI